MRKGKKVVFFEYALRMDWQGELLDEDGKVAVQVEGELTIPDVDQESVVDGDYELQVTVDGSAAGAEPLAAAMRKGDGAASIRETLSTFWKELQAR